MHKVAVLVAVYNSSPFLRQCLDSLLSQTLADIQVIAIDDCSTDDSPQILEDYARKDNRIVVVRLAENSGQAHARNVGLGYADSEYVCMVDSDDWLSRDALHSAVDVFEKNEKTDCVLFTLIKYFDDNQRKLKYDMDDDIQLSGQDAFIESLTWRIHGLYVIRTSLHKKFPFDESSRLYSDDNTTRIHFLNSREVRICQGIYFYRQHESSMTHHVSVRRFDYLLANESMKQQLISEHVTEKALNIFENHRWINVVGIYMFYYLHGGELSERDRLAGLSIIHHSWQGIETQRLNPSLKYKFGYIPFHAHWHLFLIQENIYFFFRKLLKRI